MSAKKPKEKLEALEAARHLRSLGFQAIPSSLTLKRPTIPYAEYWETMLPERHFTPLEWNCTNVQVMTGGWPWGLVVVDCDGMEANNVFMDRLKAGEYNPRTWVSISGSNKSFHYWYSVPKWEGFEIKSRWIWAVKTGVGPDGRDVYRKHSAIEVLADRHLATAPPSYHPEFRSRYRWVEGCSPRDVRLPSIIPAWILQAPEVRDFGTNEKSRFKKKPVLLPLRRGRASDFRYDRSEVLSAIHDKVSLAVSWGLEISRQFPNRNGFIACHAVSRGGKRGDRSESASIKTTTGQYWEHPGVPGSIGKTVSLFDLGSMLQPGTFPTWRECLEWCAIRYGVKPVRKSEKIVQDRRR